MAVLCSFKDFQKTAWNKYRFLYFPSLTILCYYRYNITGVVRVSLMALFFYATTAFWLIWSINNMQLIKYQNELKISGG
jgi:hypothetical protein